MVGQEFHTILKFSDLIVFGKVHVLVLVNDPVGHDPVALDRVGFDPVGLVTCKRLQVQENSHAQSVVVD